ncbi:DUF6234 family protein [Streptomyces sp. NPDC047017]|uniref:DUF6234 family protein n=1 Tax=Streptomyces sp. NPDC047017 TaxID=3155024 RepID=UPI0033CB2103
MRATYRPGRTAPHSPRLSMDTHARHHQSRQPADMTDTSPAAARRRRPWSCRTRLGMDLAFAIPLLLLEIAWLAVDSIYGYGLDVWAAQGDQAHIDAAALAYMGRLRTVLVVLLVLAVLACVFRARWTVVAHLLVALLAGGLLSDARQEWDHSHSPPPGCVRYSADC